MLLHCICGFISPWCLPSRINVFERFTSEFHAAQRMTSDIRYQASFSTKDDIRYPISGIIQHSTTKDYTNAASRTHDTCHAVHANPTNRIIYAAWAKACRARMRIRAWPCWTRRSFPRRPVSGLVTPENKVTHWRCRPPARK